MMQRVYLSLSVIVAAVVVAFHYFLRQISHVCTICLSLAFLFLQFNGFVVFASFVGCLILLLRKFSTISLKFDSMQPTQGNIIQWVDLHTKHLTVLVS